MNRAAAYARAVTGAKDSSGLPGTASSPAMDAQDAPTPRMYRSLWHGLQPWPLSMAEIAADICERHDIGVGILRAPVRGDLKVCAARTAFIGEVYATGRFSLCQVGRFLGGRHHTTILHGVRVHARRAAACLAAR